MTRLGLPVPPGFTVTTEACRAFLATGREPDGLADEIAEHLAALEEPPGGGSATRRPAAGLGPLGRPVLDARHDGDDPRHRPERRLRARAGRGRRATSGSPGTPTAGWSRCSAHRPAAWTATSSTRALDDLKRAAAPATDVDLHAADLAGSSRLQGHLRAGRRARTSRRTRASSCGGPCSPSSAPGTANAPASTGAASTSPTTWAPRSTCSAWSSATSAPTRAAASPSPATRPPGGPASTATTCRTPRARTSSPVSATPSARSALRALDPASYTQLLRSHARPWRPTTGTCATSSSPSSGAGCGCSRPGSASAPPRPPSPSPTSSSTRALITPDEALARVDGGTASPG